MATIIVIGSELRVIARWIDSMRAAGHECRVVPVSALRKRALPPADACMVDLGPRAGDLAEHITGMSGANPELRFIAMTAKPTVAEGMVLLQGGVRGYCNRLAAPAVVDALLTTVLDGGVWAGRQVTDHLLALSMQRPATPPSTDHLLDKLTAREAEIARDVAEGRSNKAIAIDHGISERTVKAHLNSIFRKTGIRSRVQLALALTQGEAPSRRSSNG
jgi:DNA-binding NarL/FixJ family response regulator